MRESCRERRFRTLRSSYVNRMGFCRTVVALVAVLLPVNSEANRCPSELPNTSQMEIFNERCYQFVGEERYWPGARDYCSQRGGRLVKINDPDTNDFIVRTLNALWWRNNGIWIGLNDRSVENRWQWVGMMPYTSDPVQWTNWGRGHPRGILHSMRDCVRMVRGSGDWRWHETPCEMLNWKYRFICEYEATPQVEPTATARAPVFADHRGDRRPDASERRVDVTVQSTSLRETPVYSSQLVENTQVTEDNSPVHAAVVDDGEQLQSANSNKWYVVVIGVGAVAVLLLVGFVLFRRRRHLNAVFTSHRFVAESPVCAKSTKTSDKPSNCPSNLDTFSSLHRVKSNIYVPHGTLTLRDPKPCQDALRRQDSLTDDSDIDSPVSSSTAAAGAENHAYVAMNGNSSCGKYVLADEVRRGGMPDIPHVTENPLPEYENCTEGSVTVDSSGNGCADDDADCGAATYDVPRTANIYSEIPEADCGIYESLENLKIV